MGRSRCRPVTATQPSLVRWFSSVLRQWCRTAAAALVELSDPAVARARGAAASERARGQLSSEDPFPALLADYERARR